jgi:prepilin-type N-terminal cleavage/methylation domain-containing protein
VNKPQTQSVFSRWIKWSSSNHEHKSGFTLIEMLVAIAVMVTFISGMFFSRGDFDSTVRLNSIARETALLVRQAQTYGAGGGGEELQVGKPYGIYLDGGSAEEIILYSEDSPADGYDSGSDLKIESLQLPEPYTISDFCFDTSNPIVSPDYCDDANSGISDLSIFFVRPSLEASFQSDTGNATSSVQAAIEITHESSGNTKRVIIDQTGYISTP